KKKERWHTFPKPFIGGFAQFASYFHENLMIHSPVYGLKDNQYMVADSYYEIGTMSTAGCLRTTTEAAYWIYTYCPEGTEVEIVNGSPKEMTAEKPPKPSAGFPWMDPTDPFRPVSKWNELSSLFDSKNYDYVYVTDSFPASGTVKLPEGMNSIPIRDGPGEDKGIIGYLSNGTTVTVINKFEQVCEINFFNTSAYIDKNYIAIGEKYIMPYTEKLYVAALSMAELPAFNTEVNELLKDDLVDVRSLDDTIEIDMLFASESNFASEKLYPSQVCLIQSDTGAKLVEAQRLFQKDGFRIKIYDAYRPYTVQGKLYEIVRNSAYIANPATTASRHNRGTALDMTIVDDDGNELAMATPVHTFGPASRIDNPGMTEEQKANLSYMQDIMTQCGFVTYNYEWWHFSDENSLDYMVTDYDLTKIIYSN
ncbi:MAG: M15 family metallopeptidase, partial [Eubacteriales bacterium]|nr:M15 family metallopeptidase [Eubacteriales bacterium]